MPDLERRRDDHVLMEIGKISGQIDLLQQMIVQQGDATRQRIDDLQSHMTQRLESLEGRVAELETGEKKLIWKVGPVSGVIAVAATEALSYLLKR